MLRHFAGTTRYPSITMRPPAGSRQLDTLHRYGTYYTHCPGPYRSPTLGRTVGTPTVPAAVHVRPSVPAAVHDTAVNASVLLKHCNDRVAALQPMQPVPACVSPPALPLQVVWKSTKELGCAVVNCANGMTNLAWGRFYMVCRWG